ncbi:MSMEG_1061 family FMN-dependent PPOX-type flavoprotein [Amycolatopsis sp. PS_44_ISF1]|uniref:MSMEG_1061 family FMN-dependent PPOX-type flavoprotein n=1 Tax=Amycolatopsis sp. PS_44_ISF1 TaxID=2974917 RepID=UPI0028DDEDCE|nr:MSMEG_1061 family FMN-dependent PPOX-type flavoprotein [Amycolatopsis sp. PS_44_ISF1]MDT8913055.1 pyridoxamine 5'-phosphate oxidase family protein [Amycolatopsis sp. PS_44_ISF1]
MRDDWELVTTEEQLREVVDPPAPVIAAKGLAGVDALSRRFIAASKLFFVATTGPDGALDLSPRGDDGRTVLVFDDDRTIAFADRAGNRRLDSFRNLLRHPQIGLLFVVPGVTEVLRVNGTAKIVRSAPFFAELDDPKLAVVVDVEELFVHCGRAFLRSGAWKPETWPERSSLPTGAQLLKSQLEAAGYTG